MSVTSTSCIHLSPSSVVPSVVQVIPLSEAHAKERTSHPLCKIFFHEINSLTFNFDTFPTMNWKLWLTKAKARLPHHLHYIPLHFAFFVIFSLLGGLIIQRIEGNINYADALFTATSACCVTGMIRGIYSLIVTLLVGLSTLDTSTLKPGSQVVS